MATAWKSLSLLAAVALVLSLGVVGVPMISQAEGSDPDCGCGNICVNETGWWRNGSAFNASATPIRDAVNNATSGDVICVKDGAYHENVDVNTAHLTIQSENGTANCVVNATNPDAHVFNVTADLVNITGFTVENATGNYTAGICLWDGVDHCNISNNNATDNGLGIYLHSANNNHLTNNTANSNTDGIYLSSSSTNTFTNNTASDNNNGIYLNSSSNNTISNCSVHDNSGDGIVLSSSSNNNTITNCTTYNNNYPGSGIWLNSSANNDIVNCTSYHNFYNGIVLTSSSDNNTMTNCTIYDNCNNDGIYLSSSSNTTITNCTVYDNSRSGFELYKSSNNTISNCTVHDNTFAEGIYLWSSSDNNNITNCTIYKNYNNGICLASSSHNTITDCAAYNSSHYHGIRLLSSSNNNTITYCTLYYNDADGINMADSSNNQITNCPIHNNTADGIELHSSSNNNITNCTVRDDSRGILLDSSANNTLRNNTLEDNTNNFGVYGENISHYYQDIDLSNTVNGEPIYYVIEQNGLTFNQTMSIGYLGLVSCGNTAIENLISPNNIQGLLLANTSYSTITNCTIYDNSDGVYLWSSSNNNVTNCPVYHNYWGISLKSYSNNNTMTSYSVYNNTYGGIFLDYSSNNNITNNGVYNNTYLGVLLQDSLNNQITNCTVHDQYHYGVKLYKSSNNTITNCTVYNTYYYDGIQLISSSNNNTITNCTVYNNTDYGILLSSSSNSDVISCNVYNNSEYGIWLGSSSNSHITNCTVYNNTEYGIYLSSSSNDNALMNNTVNSNTEYGIKLSSSSNNTIYNNYFANTNNTYDNGNNTWNTTNTTGPNIAGGPYIGGNYWSDYTGNDTDGDGFGDAPYNITSGSNKDYLPLVAVGGQVCICGDICVNETGWWRDGGDFNASATPIRDAVNNATSGDVICVKDGNYHENVDVNTANLTIKSQNGTANCVVNAANPSDHVFDVTASWVNITGFMVENATGGGKAGIWLGSSVSHCNISSNNATNNYFGIWLSSSSSNTLVNNTAFNNLDSGIVLASSSEHNTIDGNNATSNTFDGILLNEANYTTIMNNTGSNNGDSGIKLYYSSSNTLTNNTAWNNTEYGIKLDSSSSNTIYNNYFSNAVNAWDNGANTWNTTNTTGPNIIGGPYIGGNYWSDYTGNDTNGDGFGDTELPYNCTGNITNGGDYLPLILTPRATLTVNVTPSNTGNVTVNGTTPTSYPNTTTWNYGENVTLNATAASGYHFVNWTGNLTVSTNPTNITMDADKNVTANFAPLRTLTMAITGNGTTVPAIGNYTYGEGTVVNITATADSGWQFVNWTTANMSEIGNYTAQSTTVTVDENKTVTANFAEVTGATLEGHVSFNGRGTPPDNKWIEPFVVKGFESGNLSHVLWTTNATTNNTGVFTITGVTPGTYDVGIKNWTCLSEVNSSVTLTAGETTVVNFGTTREGDCDNNDHINILDASFLASRFGSGEGDPGWSPLCDFNRDTHINILDASALASNFGQGGDLVS